MAWVFLTSNLEKYNKINWILYYFWHLINNSSDIKLFIFGLFYYQWPFKLATRNHICSSICSQQRVHWGQEKILKAFSDSCCEASCTLRGQDCELFPYSQGLSKLSCWIILEYTFPAELRICDGGIHLFLLFPIMFMLLFTKQRLYHTTQPHEHSCYNSVTWECTCCQLIRSAQFFPCTL